MTIELYFLIAFLFMGVDALVSYSAGKDYNPLPSLTLSCVWPLAVLVIIVAASKCQR